MPNPVLNIKIIAVGKMKDRLLCSKTAEYLERTSHDSRIEIVEVRDLDIGSEGQKIGEILKKESAYIFALSEEGRQYESVDFARNLEFITRKIIFVIGGPFGLSTEVKKSADEILSLSKMTFTHEIARMLLLEQIYRSISIIRHRGYHKP